MGLKGIIKGFTNRALSEAELLNQEIKKQGAYRYSICKSCERFNKERTTCMECGCYMKNKTLVPGAKCPLKKW